jgi:hypothetical protein
MILPSAWPDSTQPNQKLNLYRPHASLCRSTTRLVTDKHSMTVLLIGLAARFSYRTQRSRMVSRGQLHALGSRTERVVHCSLAYADRFAVIPGVAAAYWLHLMHSQ